MATRGRPPGFRMDDSHRTKIANSKILSRLIGHVEGTVEMSGSQVTAGIALLKKVMPDLTENKQLHGEDPDNPLPASITLRLVRPNVDP